MRFCGVSRVLKDGLKIAFLLNRELNDPRIEKIEFIQPMYFIHYLKIKNEKDLDKELLSWIKKSYKMGMREHIKRNT